MNQTEQNKNLLDAAHKYLKRGWGVIPFNFSKSVLENGKIKKQVRFLPTYKEYHSKKILPEQIEELWNGYNGIAVVTGSISGITAIDIDCKDLPEMNDMPETFTVETYKGYHFYYQYTAGVKNVVECFWKDGKEFNIDIRNTGGIVYADPSEYELPDGKVTKYKIIKDVPLAEFPVEWLKNVYKKYKPGGINRKGEFVKSDWKEKMISPIEMGSRNTNFAAIIGGLLKKFSVEEWEKIVWPVVVNLNKAQSKPLTDPELFSIFRHLSQKELQVMFEGVGHNQLDGGKQKSTRISKAKTACFADIKAEPINWLWPGHLALGKTTLIAGDPGLGKSLITSMLAATVSKGYKWPLTDFSSPIGNVIMLSAEDDPADTIRPRLDAAQADCTRIHIIKSVEDINTDGSTINRIFSFKKDIATLDECISSTQDCKLVIIDPVSAYLDGTDGNSNSDIRGLFTPLAELAARHKVAIVLIQHLNKGVGGTALYRPMGSVAFIAAARTAFIVTKDPENPQKRMFMPAKNNIAKESVGLAYSIITAENNAPVIAWEQEPVTITADEALSVQRPNEDHTVTNEAVDFLKNMLITGPARAAEVIKQARQLGINYKPLCLARRKLGIKPVKSSFEGGWVWSLSQDIQDAQPAPSLNEDNLAGERHLGDKTEYVRGKICGSCGRKHTIIIPTEKNLKNNPLLNEMTEVLICRNPNCKLFQQFMPDIWWKYRHLD